MPLRSLSPLPRVLALALTLVLAAPLHAAPPSPTAVLADATPATISNSANSGTTAVSGQTCAMIGTAISAEPKPETPKAT